MFILGMDSKLFTDFFERFLFNAVGYLILLLCIIFLAKFKEINFKFKKPYLWFLLIFLCVDLLIRITYTFAMGRENQTRYFMIQALFYMIPASSVLVLIIKKEFKKPLIPIIYIIVFFYGFIISVRPKWNKPEYDVFAKIIRNDPNQYKHISIVEKEDDGSLTFEDDFRISYYSGIYRDKKTQERIRDYGGSLYYVTEEKFDIIGNYEIKLVSEIEEKDGDMLYLYKALRAPQLSSP